MAKRLRILTWHVRGNYLHYLTQVPHDWYLVTDDARSPQHSGRSGTLPWGDNVHEAHDPPQEHPTDTRHWVNDRNVLLAHVTPFNALMWDSGDSPTRVIEHGAAAAPGALQRRARGAGCRSWASRPPSS